ncbi:hypothetical protein GCM10027589_06280 [Actinocorallia lasiicapitis]
MTAWWKRLPLPRQILAAGLLAAVALGAVLAVVLHPEDEPPRARQYLSSKACLLTGAKGLADASARPAWDGMQQASLKTRTQVQYFAVTGPATVANATPYLGTLISLECDLIIAAGKLPAATVRANAARFGDRSFVVLGGTGGGNVTAISEPADRIPARIAELITDGVKGKED